VPRIQFPHLQPEVGDGGERTGVPFRGVGFVVDVDLIDEVVFRRPVVELVHPPLDAEPGPSEVHGIGESGIEPALLRGLVGPRGRREGDGIHLRATADLDAEVLVGGLVGEALVPLGLHAEVAADLVALVGFRRLLRGGWSVGPLAVRLRGRGGGGRIGERFGRGRGAFLEVLDAGLEHRNPGAFVADRLRHLLERPELRGHARQRQRFRRFVFGDDQKRVGRPRGQDGEPCPDERRPAEERPGVAYRTRQPRSGRAGGPRRKTTSGRHGAKPPHL